MPDVEEDGMFPYTFSPATSIKPTITSAVEITHAVHALQSQVREYGS